MMENGEKKTAVWTSADEAPTVHYQLDPLQSKFTVQAFATGLLSGFGHNPTIAIRDFSGDAQFVPGTFANASLNLVIKTTSLTVINELKEKDRQEIEEVMHRDVLETSHYPQIVFESTNVTATKINGEQYKTRIIGDLTLHGVTRQNLWLYAYLKVDEESLCAQGEFMLRQVDFKIKPVSVAGGTLRLKNELKFSFNIIAQRAG